MADTSDSTPLSRRGFAMALSTGSLAGVLVAAYEPDSQSSERAPLVSGDKSPDAGGKLETDPTELLTPEELLLAAHLQLYPSDRMTPERWQGLHDGLRRNRINHDILCRVPLDNSDEPATVFRVWSGER
jgi:hypothetical protein